MGIVVRPAEGGCYCYYVLPLSRYQPENRGSSEENQATKGPEVAEETMLLNRFCSPKKSGISATEASNPVQLFAIATHFRKDSSVE